MEDYISEFKRIIREVLLQLDPEEAQLFLDLFTEKLDEQKRIKENPRTPR